FCQFIRHSLLTPRPFYFIYRELLPFHSFSLLDALPIFWCTEFGRMPMFQKGSAGRDHNPDGFTCWMTGAGVKPGVSHGRTDDLGDRKSTRLNSSHVKISYAVFCLKKKSNGCLRSFICPT